MRPDESLAIFFCIFILSGVTNVAESAVYKRIQDGIIQMPSPDWRVLGPKISLPDWRVLGP